MVKLTVELMVPTTVILKEHVATRLLHAVAVQTTFVVPIGKLLPLPVLAPEVKVSIGAFGQPVCTAVGAA